MDPTVDFGPWMPYGMWVAVLATRVSSPGDKTHIHPAAVDAWQPGFPPTTLSPPLYASSPMWAQHFRAVMTPCMVSWRLRVPPATSRWDRDSSWGFNGQQAYCATISGYGGIKFNAWPGVFASKRYVELYARQNDGQVRYRTAWHGTCASASTVLRCAGPSSCGSPISRCAMARRGMALHCAVQASFVAVRPPKRRTGAVPYGTYRMAWHGHKHTVTCARCRAVIVRHAAPSLGPSLPVWEG